MTGTGSAFVAFLASFPTLWIAKQVIFGYVSNEMTLVTDENWRDFMTHLNEMQIALFRRAEANNVQHQVSIMTPAYHRRLLGYKVEELS